MLSDAEGLVEVEGLTLTSQCPLEHCMLSDEVLDVNPLPRNDVSMPSRALYAF